MKTPKVFISSTLEDLAEYRKAALEAILRLNWQPLDCGYWAGGGNPPLATCLKRVDDADVVVAIVAHRHGWTPPGQPDGAHKSITRLECERANGERRIEVIPLLVDEKAPWDAKLMETHRINEAKPDDIAAVAEEVARNVQALKDFTSWLDTIGTRKSFSIASQLETEVLHALSAWREHRGLPDTGVTNASIRCALSRLAAAQLRIGRVTRPGLKRESKRTAGPSLCLSGDDGESHRTRWQSGREKPDELLLHRLGNESLYVPGSPGSGKSTFCRWAALLTVLGQVPAHPIDAPDEFAEQLPMP